MSEYITLFKEQHIINGNEQGVEIVFKDLKDGLLCYKEHYKTYEKIRNIASITCKKGHFECEDEVDIFDETKDEAYVMAYIEIDSALYKADTEMLYTISLQQLEKAQYEKLKKNILAEEHIMLTEDNEELLFK